MSEPYQLRLDELNEELSALILIRHENDRHIIKIKKMIEELEKTICGITGHIWRPDKYGLQMCALCISYRTSSL